MTNSLIKWACQILMTIVPLVTMAQSKNETSGGEIEGWIVRKLPDGRVIKVPKKQKFKFNGPQIEGGVQRPPETVLRPSSGARQTSLIPVRKSYRQEAMGVSAYRERTVK